MSEKNNPSIAIGSDHGGFLLKEELKKYLKEKNYEVKDCGTHSTDPVDYPTIAFSVAKKVSDGDVEFGIIIDGAGIGSAMVANKLDGVRAALCYDVSSANNAREHNNANVLTLGAGLIGASLAKQIVDTFLSTFCTVERHLRRVKMIDAIGANGKQENDKTEPGNLQETDSTKIEENFSLELTDSDLRRVAEKIRELMGSELSSSDKGRIAVCGDAECTDCGLCADKAPDSVRHFIDIGADRISHSPSGGKIPMDIAKYIDHTLLKPDARAEDIIKLCAEAREYKFASVCISPTYVPLAAKELANTPVDVCTVVGFPHGAQLPEVKAFETRQAIRNGAKEIDMVINIGALKNGDEDFLYRDIRMVVEACEDGSALSKVIIEAALLTDDEKIMACKISKRARANYVKTSTGFGPGGATEHDVALMSGLVREAGMGVKAAGGIRSLEDAKKMITAGATRIGASAGVKIVSSVKDITFSN